MCGINGFSWSDARLIRRMNAAIRHRGPDDSGVVTTAAATLGHLRLSIIDLSPAGHQPMFYDRRRGACSDRFRKELCSDALPRIVFNGEIYNFQELRDELAALGYPFTTRSDTEVILAAYLQWGFECVKRFNGMWSFCIHDPKKKILFCSRDRLGVKPFYYAVRDGSFIFSSELKAIVEHKELKLGSPDSINTEAIELYFALGFIPAPWTIYTAARKLEAAHSLVFDCTRGTVKTWRYYELPLYAPVHDRRALLAEGKALLRDAVRLRMIADVPVGAFLSGGLDSSTVVGEMRELTDPSKLHTFSIGFEGKYDESHYITLVKDAFKTKHHHQYFRRKDFDSLLTTYAHVYDEPFGDYSGFPTYVVAALARKHVTVSLSGDGGDEIFGGYTTHALGVQFDLLRSFPRFARSLGAKMPATKRFDNFASLYLLREACRISLLPPERFYAEALADDGIKPEVYKEWTTKSLKRTLAAGKGSMAEALRLHDLAANTLADNFLVKVDRASMAHALEVRSPFLDYRFIEFSQRIPTAWKLDARRTKKFMRELIRDIVPKEIVERGKQGFTPPLAQWITEPAYAPMIAKAHERLRILHPGLWRFFDEKALREHNKIYTNYTIRLFLFELWCQEWLTT